TELFKRETIERFSSYFKRVIGAMTGDPAKQISAVEIISADEKKQVLYDFNDTAVEYPREKTIHCLYEEQSAQTPDHIVIVGFVELDRSVRTVRPVSLSYNELNMQSHRLAGLLIKKGVLPGDIVAIKMARSIEMVIAILGTLKSGGAYMPIDPDYPQERIDYMLKDSNARILINKSEARISKFETNSNDRNPNRISDFNFSNLAYVIYTSGSTGKPKGVMVEHRSVIRLVINNDFVELSERLRVLQTGAPVFDAVTFEMWGPLLNGGQLYLVDNEVILEPGKLGRALKKYHINTLWLTSSLFNQLARQDSTIFSTLEWLVVGGDVLSPGYIAEVRRTNNHLKMVNGYGPTENTTFSVCHCIDRDYPNNIPIGKPIANSCAYILDKRGHLQPIGIPGELYVGGDGLARGYLNNPELTAEKFNKDLWDYQNKQDEKNKSFAGVKGGLFQKPPLVTYKTGDLARWLPGGVIEFLGRIDRQVKIRGFRVELEEIENRLVGHEEIKEAVVTVDGGEDKSLCAYITGAREFGADELRGYLGLELPAYMIPAYFVQLEKLPLTVNGKVDRLALPAPQLRPGETYIAPADEIEEKIVGIWTNVLGVKKDAIGVNDDFFHLGGHSLKATLLASQVSKTFNVEFPLTAVFTGPTVKEMANVVRRGRKSLYGEIKPVEKREYYPLSSAQKRLYFLEQLENIGVSYNIPAVLKVEGELDKSHFKQAVDDLIQRHEALRTSFCLVNNEPVQVIHDRVDIALNLENIDRDTQDLHDVHEILEYSMRFIRPFDLSRAPLLRVALVALREGGYFLFYDIHHIICDGTSLGTLITDFIKLYFQEELLPLKIQYKDFTLWQNGWFESGAIKKQQEYWLNVYKDISGSGGKIPRLNLPTDYPRPDIQTFTGEKYEFKLESENLANLNRLKTRYGTTLYMNLLAVFNVLLFKYTDREDIIVGSGIGERTHADMQGLLGMFVNTLPMRNHPRPDMRFVDFLKEVKVNCIQAFENQDMQFEELVERLELKRDPSHNPLFDVEFNLQNFTTPGNENQDKTHDQTLETSGTSFINLGNPDKTSKFDMILYAQEVGNQILFLLEYATALFKRETINQIARHYIEIINQVTADEEIVIKDIRVSHDFVTVPTAIEDNEFGF
ncbi:MAG TPA: amino acid adenylation domain-containing protein, partial [Candidatus Deferrimicrobium sp.]|nr:amino acid adenylation domain-containing protein [Candidatus Deferrimicrobium sp.]